MVSAYIYDVLTPHDPDGCLRSTNGSEMSQLVIKYRALAAPSPLLWNSLPGGLCLLVLSEAVEEQEA